MKRNKISILVSLMLLGAINLSVAQNSGTGNAFENEVTPMLREVARLKSQADMKKLQREIDKIAEEEEKAKIELEKASKEAKNSSNSKSAPSQIAQVQPMVPPGQANQQQMAAPEEDFAAKIKVVMVYGFDNDLSAKIVNGDMGGYVVKVGDILPAGQKVEKITNYFMEVSEEKMVKGKNVKKSKRIPVAAYSADNGNNQQGQQQMNPGQQAGQVPLSQIPIGPYNPGVQSLGYSGAGINSSLPSISPAR